MKMSTTSDDDGQRLDASLGLGNSGEGRGEVVDIAPLLKGRINQCLVCYQFLKSALISPIWGVLAALPAAEVHHRLERQFGPRVPPGPPHRRN
jgi:hypothetical protein